MATTNHDYYIKKLGEELRSVYLAPIGGLDTDYAFSESDFRVVKRNIELKLGDLTEQAKQPKNSVTEETAKILADTGKMISESTVEKIIRDKYIIPERADGRVKATLEKIAIYLNYRSWEHFVTLQKAKMGDEEIGHLTAFLTEALTNSLDCFREDKFNEKQMSAFYTTDGYSFRNLRAVMYGLSEYHFLVLEAAPPNKILEINDVQAVKDFAVVFTEEWWKVLLSENEIEEKYKSMFVTRGHIFIYRLRKINNEWRIVDKTRHGSPYESIIEVYSRQRDKNY